MTRKPDVTETAQTRRQFLQLSAASAVAGLAGCLGQKQEQGSLQQLPCRGKAEHLENVTKRPSQGRDHVEAGTDLNYKHYPPTSGTHYSTTVAAGFYEEPQPLGAIVHSLEHGAVIIYYEPGALSGSAKQDLKDYANTYTGTWSSVIVVPYGRDNPASTYALTAWRHILRLETYDEDVVRSFIAEYLGRGPENNVRECE